MRVRWLASAARGRQHQLDYLAERDPHAAIAAGDRLRAATRLLSEHPSIGRPGRYAGTREWVVSRTPFLLVYRIEADVVTILRLFHGAQERPGYDRAGPAAPAAKSDSGPAG